MKVEEDSCEVPSDELDAEYRVKEIVTAKNGLSE